MNFLLTVCAVFLTYYHQVNQSRAFEFDLDGFMKNFEKSQTELKWIRDQSRKVEGKDSVFADSEESKFDEDDESSADLWYNKYRKSECSMDHANPESKILNGYCGVDEDNSNEHSGRKDGFSETNFLKHPARHQIVSDYKIESQEIKNDGPALAASNSNFGSFDNFHEEADQNHDDLDLGSASKLSPEDKLNMEEYNDQMIPNPNFYKINNEMSAHNEQINKEHDDFRNDLGFSSVLNKYPLSEGDIYSQMENDYGNENQNKLKHRVIQRKRNARDFNRNDVFSPESSFNQSPYDHLNDQADTAKNNLSHEADYKLSKNEQDPEAKRWPYKNENEFQEQSGNEPQNDFRNKAQNANKYQNNHKIETGRHNNQFQKVDENTNTFINHNPSKQNSNSLSKGNLFPKKQSLNSAKHSTNSQLTDEINLKISNRMMSRGLGPSLPSQSIRNLPNSYRHPFNVDVENQHWEDNRNKNSYDVGDYVGLQRHLLQFDYEDSLKLNDYPGEVDNSARNLIKIGLIKTVNNDKFSNNRAISKDSTANSNDEKHLKNSENNEKNYQLSEKKNEGSLKSGQAPSENQKLLNLEKCVNGCKDGYNDKNDGKNVGRRFPNNSTTQKEGDPKIEPKAKSNQSESNSTLGGNIKSIKLQLELDLSNVTTDENGPTEKLKNEDINDHAKIVKRSSTYGKPLGLQESKMQRLSMNSTIADLVSGKLPNQLIQAVFQLVKENSRLNKLIGSKLDMQRANNLEENSINLFKSKQKTERIVKKLMSSITGLIEDQITHQTCILLPPDLQSFYDKVIYVRSINSRVNNMRKENQESADNNKNSSKRIVRSTVPESDLHEKYKTVGNLLKHYGHLNLRDQMKIFEIKQFLQNHLELLDDLKSLNSDIVRQSRSIQKKSNRATKLLEMEKGARHISREYANLLKTTKLIKTTSLTSMDENDVVSSYSYY